VATPIRQTAFTWDSARESRSQVAARVTAHLHRELDRIHADQKLGRQLARRQANPHYVRNQQITEASREGVSHRELGRRYGMAQQRVREIVRIEAAWQGRLAQNHSGTLSRRAARHASVRDLPEAPAAIPQTRAAMTDP
jgi:hypothetical protein